MRFGISLYKKCFLLIHLFRLDLKLDDFSVFGTPLEQGKIPQLVESQNLEADKQYALVSLLVEVNPSDGKADQRIRLNTRPIKIAYDAVSVHI